MIMKYSGPLGIPRLVGLGPFTHNVKIPEEEAPIYEDKEEIAEEVAQIVKEQNISTEDLTTDDVAALINTMAIKIFPPPEVEEPVNIEQPVDLNELLQIPDVLIARAFFKRCMISKWAIGWSDGLAIATHMDLGDIEQLVLMMYGCVSLIQGVDDVQRLIMMLEGGPVVDYNEGQIESLLTKIERVEEHEV